jgi:LysM repeat protein
VKRAFSSNLSFVILALILTVSLTACERPLQDVPEPTETPAFAPTVPPAVLPPMPLEPTMAPMPDGSSPDGEMLPAVPDDTGVTEPPPVGDTGPVTYVIQPGDTLFSIAQQYSVSIDDLAAANGISPNDLLTPGQTLSVPVGGLVITPVPPADGQERTHVVQSGENLFRIGLQYGCSISELATYNGIANPDVLSAGQVLRIPPNCTGN